jgi:hypothetical protein
MNAYSVQTLISDTTFGTPSGNYDGSSQDWSGDRQQAANYYGGFGGLQTIAYYLNGFQGRIKIEATLDSDPVTDAAWFKVNEFDSTSTTTTNNFSVNITGNFTWIRANVEDFDAGTITKLYMSY